MNEAAQSQQPSPAPKAVHHVLTGTLFRKRGRLVAFRDKPPPPQPEPVRRPHTWPACWLWHHLQGAIDRGLVPDRAAVARRLGFTRARVTQLLDLLLLAPDIQVKVLEMEAEDGREPKGTMSEAELHVLRARLRGGYTRTSAQAGVSAVPLRDHRRLGPAWDHARSKRSEPAWGRRLLRL